MNRESTLRRTTAWGTLVGMAAVLVSLILLRPGLVAAAPAIQRPISDFLTTQGTTQVFLDPVPDLLGWSDPALVRLALVDYTGEANHWMMDQGHSGLGTTTQGTITERPLADGRAELHINLHTRNALVWVIDGFDEATDPKPSLLFGYRAPDLVDNPSLQPGLGIAHLQIVLIVPTPGAPVPDLVDAFILGNTPPGVELVFLALHVQASGPLRSAFGVADGTGGKATVQQTGVLFRGPFQGATADGFPVEFVDLRKVGR